jgi:hypothetical protein
MALLILVFPVLQGPVGVGTFYFIGLVLVDHSGSYQGEEVEKNRLWELSPSFPAPIPFLAIGLFLAGNLLACDINDVRI